MVSAPIPATRTKQSLKTPPPPTYEEVTRRMSIEDGNNNNVNASASAAAAAVVGEIEDDDLTLDLDMFTPRAGKELQSQQVVKQQLQLQSAQKAEAERRRLDEQEKRELRESGRTKVNQQLVREKVQLETLEQKQQTGLEELPVPRQRKHWTLPADVKLDLLSPELSSPEDGSLHSPVHRLKSEAKTSRSSSASEFFSLSEDEKEPESTTPVVIRNEPVTPRNSTDNDADAAFQALCVALAEQKRLSSRVQDISVKEEEEEEEEEEYEKGAEDDDEESSDETAFWRRSDRGWASERQYPASSSRPTSLARRKSSLDGSQLPRNQQGPSSTTPADPLYFPSLSNSDYRNL